MLGVVEGCGLARCAADNYCVNALIYLPVDKPSHLLIIDAAFVERSDKSRCDSREYKFLHNAFPFRGYPCGALICVFPTQKNKADTIGYPKMIPYSKGTGLAFIKIALRTKRQSCESYFAKPAELPTQEIRLGVLHHFTPTVLRRSIIAESY